MNWKSCSFYRGRFPEHLNSCQDDPLSSKTPIQDFVDGGELSEDDTLDECLGQVVHFIETGVLRSYQDHICLLRLQLNKYSKA